VPGHASASVLAEVHLHVLVGQETQAVEQPGLAHSAARAQERPGRALQEVASLGKGQVVT
jgi:hypothetical protein